MSWPLFLVVMGVFTAKPPSVNQRGLAHGFTQPGEIMKLRLIMWDEFMKSVYCQLEEI